MTFSVKFYDARDITPRAAKNIIVFYFLFFLQKNFITNTVNVVRREIIMILGPLKIDDLLGKNVLNICQAWRSLWQKVLVVVSLHIIGLLRKTEEKQEGLGKENTVTVFWRTWLNSSYGILIEVGWIFQFLIIITQEWSNLKSVFDHVVTYLDPTWCIKVTFTSLIGT